jgi:ketosteroid isomerase-like protein
MSSQSAQENMNLIRRWVEAVNRNDVRGELACWQPDGEFFIVPTGTTYKGTAEIEQAGRASAAMVGAQPAQGRKQITSLFASEDCVCVEYDAQAAIAGPIEVGGVTILAEGASRTLELKVCVVAQIRDGKMDRAREYFDSSSMARQLGLDGASLGSLYGSLASEKAGRVG